jgi:lysophospholipase L1-like esterase
MPFGDSITDGYNADTPGGYRVELFKRAHADSKNITFVGSGSNGPSTVDGVAFPPRHEGHSGWTIYPETSGRYRDGISYCLSANSNGKCLASNSVMSEYKPDIVLLMIGTNDCIDSYDLANAPTRLGTLIDTIFTQLPNVLIVVAQPIPSRGNASKGDDAALPDRLKTYGDAIPAVVQKRADAGKHILLVDMYTPFNPNKASLIEDEWHPNLQGYVLLGDQWYSVLKPLL